MITQFKEFTPAYNFYTRLKGRLIEVTRFLDENNDYKVIVDKLIYDIQPGKYVNIFLYDILYIYLNSMKPDLESFIFLVNSFMIGNKNYTEIPLYLEIIHYHFSLYELEDLEKILESGEL